jgi:periplasmic divalent cation tolerance protein
MFIAWTTVSNRADAEHIAADVVARNLALCVQIDGPIVSHYRWKGQPERAEEFRLCFKCMPTHLEPLARHVLATHPYETPEWIVVPIAHVGEKYLSWANANSTTPPL